MVAVEYVKLESRVRVVCHTVCEVRGLCKHKCNKISDTLARFRLSVNERAEGDGEDAMSHASTTGEV